MEGDLYQEDPETGIRMPVEKEFIRMLVLQFSGILGICADCESGRVTVTLSEYERLPAKFIDIWRAFAKAKADGQSASIHNLSAG
jgi:hypothetical protein